LSERQAEPPNTHCIWGINWQSVEVETTRDRPITRCQHGGEIHSLGAMAARWNKAADDKRISRNRRASGDEGLSQPKWTFRYRGWGWISGFSRSSSQPLVAHRQGGRISAARGRSRRQKNERHRKLFRTGNIFAVRPISTPRASASAAAYRMDKDGNGKYRTLCRGGVRRGKSPAKVRCALTECNWRR